MAFDDQAEQLFAKVFQRPATTTQERSFLQSAAQRKQGGALQGALESAQQRGQFSGGQATSGQAQQDPLDQALEKLQGVGRKLDDFARTQSTKEIRSKVREAFLAEPAMQDIIKQRGELAKQTQNVPKELEGKATVKPTTQGALQGEALGNILQSLSNVSGAIQTRGRGINQIIENVRQGEQEQFERGQQQFQTQQGIINSLIQGRQEGRAQEIFGLDLQLKQAQIAKARRAGSGSGSGADVLSQLRGQPIQTLSFEDFINEQQEAAQQSFTPERIESLRDEYNVRVDSERANDPSAIAGEYERKALASGTPKFATESGREQLGRLLGAGDLDGARRLTDALGRGLNATQATELGDIRASIQVLADLEGSINAYERKFGPIKGSFATINKLDPLGQAINSQIAAARQTVGKSLEGGVLRKEDEIKYKKILATLGDFSNVAIAKTQINSTVL